MSWDTDLQKLARKLDDLANFVGKKLHTYIDNAARFLAEMGIRITLHLKLLARIAANLSKAIARIVMFFVPGVIFILLGVLVMDISRFLGVALIVVGLSSAVFILLLIYYFGQDESAEQNKKQTDLLDFSSEFNDVGKTTTHNVKRKGGDD